MTSLLVRSLVGWPVSCLVTGLGEWVICELVRRGDCSWLVVAVLVGFFLIVIASECRQCMGLIVCSTLQSSSLNTTVHQSSQAITILFIHHYLLARDSCWCTPGIAADRFPPQWLVDSDDVNHRAAGSSDTNR